LENENQNDEKNVASSQPEDQTSYLLFKKEEIDNIVREFAIGWIKGTVVIDLPDYQHLLAMEQKKGSSVDEKQAIEMEAKNKTSFMNQINIVAGYKPVTAQEYEQTVKDLFNRILRLRCGDRIKGSFGGQENLLLEINKHEEQISAMNDQIQQLIIWYRSLLQK
jgi:hypothetical protein